MKLHREARRLLFAAPALGLALSACPGEEPSEVETTGSTTDDTETSSAEDTVGPDDSGPTNDDGTTTADTDDTDDTADTLDTTDTDDTDDTTGEPGDGLVPVFIAQGSVGRTTVSCDDGQTWIHDRAYDTEGTPEVCDMVQPVVCWGGGCSSWDDNAGTCDMQGDCDCDHHPGADKGIAFGHGLFAATWGWGPPGAIKTSSNGQQWTTVVEPTTFAGMAFGNDTFVAITRSPMISADGTEWVEGGPADFRNEADEVIWNARDVGFADAAGGVFVAGASSGNGQDLMVSHDAGQSWTRPEGSWTCGGDFEAVAGHDDIIVVVFRDRACRSTDGGMSFAPIELSGRGAVYDGEQFVVWDGQQRFTSPDGARWSTTDLIIEGLPEGHNFQLGPIARSGETGTVVSVRGGWQQWYDAQDFYRSTDGVTWQVLPAGSFVPSHRIRHIAYGRLDPSVCE